MCLCTCTNSNNIIRFFLNHVVLADLQLASHTFISFPTYPNSNVTVFVLYEDGIFCLLAQFSRHGKVIAQWQNVPSSRDFKVKTSSDVQKPQWHLQQLRTKCNLDFVNQKAQKEHVHMAAQFSYIQNFQITIQRSNKTPLPHYLYPWQSFDNLTLKLNPCIMNHLVCSLNNQNMKHDNFLKACIKILSWGHALRFC